MTETFNFNMRAALFGLVLVFTVPLLILPTLLSAKRLWLARKERAVSTWLGVLGVSLLAGCLISETCVLRDEARFSTEIAKENGNRYSRARAWPNQGCSQVFLPGRGIQSTD
jgi:hypothetical protein